MLRLWNGVRDRSLSNCAFVRMSGGNWCLVRNLGLVKGGKGLRHHEVLIDFSVAALFRSTWRLLARSRNTLESTQPQHSAVPSRAGSTANVKSMSNAA